MAEWKTDPSRGFTFGTQAEQRARQLGPVLGPITSGVTSAADMMTLGYLPYATSAAQKGLGAAGVERFEPAKQKSFMDLVKETQGFEKAVQEQNPKSSAAGTVAGIGLSAGLLPPVARTASPTVSGVATGGLYGTLEGFSENLDPTEAIRTGVLGSVVGGVAAPVLERTIGGLSRLVSMGKNVVDHNGLLSREAASVAMAAGLDPTDVLRLGPQLGAAFKQYGLRPEAVTMARFNEFGMDPTRGMVTKDPTLLKKEISVGSEYGLPKYQGIQEQAGATARGMYGQQPSVRESVDAAVEAAERQALAAKNAGRAAYKEAEDFDPSGFFTRESISNLGDRISMDMSRDPKLGNLVTNDASKKAFDRLNKTLGAEMEVAPPLAPGLKPLTTVNQDFRAVESGRQALNEELEAAIRAGDKAGMKSVRAIIDRFDDKIEQSIIDGAYSGDPAVLDKWKNARKLWSEYQERYGVKKSGEEAGSLINDIVNKKRDPDDIARAIFNFSSGDADASMKLTALKTINQLKRALGPNSPELETIKSSFVSNLMKVDAADPRAFAKTAMQVNDFINGRGSVVARSLLTKDEYSVLNRFASVMKDAGTMPKGQLEKEISIIGQTIKMSAPAIASGLSTFLGIMHPVLATAISAPFYAKQGLDLVKKFPSVARRDANASFSGRGPLPTYPSLRVPAATAPQQYPEFQQALESANQDAESATGVPMFRASGGRTNMPAATKAARLIAQVKNIRNSHGKDTSSLLDLDDDVVAKALAVANQKI